MSHMMRRTGFLPSYLATHGPMSTRHFEASVILLIVLSLFYFPPLQLQHNALPENGHF